MTASSPTTSRLSRVLFGLVPVLMLALVASVGVVANTPGPPDEFESAPMTVTIEPAEWVDSYLVRARYVGEVRARQRVELGFELGGKLVELGFDEGDRVRAGETVGLLDVVRLDSEESRLVAARGRVEADLKLARLTLDRVRTSFESRAASEQEIDEAVQRVESLEASLDEATASIERVQIDLEKSVLRAPFDAVVSRRHLDLGAVIGEGAPVYTLLEATQPEVRIGVAPAMVDEVRVGDGASVEVRGEMISGVVIASLPELDRRTRTAEVRIGLEAALGEGLRDGDAASIELGVHQDVRGFWVPIEALTQSVRGLWAVYIVDTGEGDREGESSRVERREVELLHTETDRALVRGPVDEHESVIVAGIHRIVPGVRVDPVRAVVGAPNDAEVRDEG
ncbi:MAG: efflux RND transporter periplasmic adaptor subunit [Planctomycetota bacterium]